MILPIREQIMMKFLTSIRTLKGMSALEYANIYVHAIKLPPYTHNRHVSVYDM